MLVEQLGVSQRGEVWRATQASGGPPVVIKRLLGGLDPAARAELAALRVLNIPGVARLVDEHVDASGATTLVTEHVAGLPFPGEARDNDAVLRALRGTLRVLREVHAAGIVHRDLKPEHVLVGEDGRVTLLDFGLAAGDGARLHDPAESTAGTLRYAAPEQLTRASLADARADLYSVGLMAYEALTGALPHDAESEERLTRRRLSEPVPPLPEGFGPLAALMGGLLARKPRRRLADADAALELLDDDTLARFDAAVAHWRGPIEPSSLRRLFAGPERLLHLPTDATALLTRAHGQSSAAIAAAVRGWLRAGEARWASGAVELSREALLRLGWTPSPGEDGAQERAQLAEALRAQRWGEAEALGLGMGEAAWRRGHLDEARVAFASALLAAERAGADGRAAAERLTEVGLAGNAQRATTLALYELNRSARPHPDLEALLRAERWVRDSELPRASEALAQLPSFSAESLDRFRLALRVRLAQRRATPEAMQTALVEADAWAEARGTDTARGDALNWRGLAAYQRGDMMTAAELHGEALQLKAHGSGRLSARSNQLAALMELPSMAKHAQRAARSLLNEASLLRHAVHEGYAEWAQRAMLYRAGGPLRPDWALIEAAEHLGVRSLQGQLWFGEAAIAWRAGERATAHALSLKVVEAWRGDQRAAILSLAEALALATDEAPDEAAMMALAERARAASAEDSAALPGVWLQALGALMSASARVRQAHPSTLSALSAQVPAALRVGRRELMSLEEIEELAHT